MSEPLDLNGRIDSLLAERRPDRYEVESGSEWLDEIADEIAPYIPMSEAQFRSARLIVGNRERVKTQRTNQIIRQIAKSGQLPIGWLETINLPLAVGKERVALRAITPQDLKDFAQVERRSAANEFSTRNETCEAAEWIADQMVAVGVVEGRELSDVIPMGELDF